MASILLLAVIAYFASAALVGATAAATLKIAAAGLSGGLCALIVRVIREYKGLPLASTRQCEIFQIMQNDNMEVKISHRATQNGESASHKLSTGGGFKLQISNQTFFAQSKTIAALVEERYHAQYPARV